VQAFFLDIDYGTDGHSKANPFSSMDDAVGYLLTMPIRASVAWHTGHGVQASYLLKQPYLFPLGGGDALSMARYEEVSRKLSKMAMSDSTFTAEHAFRVPLTLNDKREKDPNLAVVRGSLLWMDEHKRYTFEDIEAAVQGYDIEDHLAEARKKAEATGTKDEGPRGEREGGKNAPYEELPEDIRTQIENVQGDRSGAMFSAVAKMVRAGYSDGTILDAIFHAYDFRKKYGARLKAEVDRCIGKIRGGKTGRYVYESVVAPAIETHNEATEIRLDGCAELPRALEEMLTRYAQKCRIELSQRLRDAARFHEHMFQSQVAGVLESPCGSGKSTWAICHIALNATKANRYLYVLETVDALYRAAETLKELAKTPVGLSHGFNQEKCRDLCGVEHSWRECLPKDPESACHACGRKTDCPFYNRASEQKKPIVCMTHEGLVRALEVDSELLKNTNILVDEDLNAFSTLNVSLDDLLHLRLRVPDLPLDVLFPCSRLSCKTELDLYGVPEGSDVYASRNFVFRNEMETAKLRPAYNILCKALAIPILENPFPGGAKTDPMRAKNTLSELLNFFRPSKQEDAFYAFRETHATDGTRYTLKRRRFSLAVDRVYRKLWILNASAQLSPYPYPDNFSVYECPELTGNSHLVTLHVVRGNPMKSKLEQNVWLSDVALYMGPCLSPGEHKKVLVVTNKDSELLDDLKAKIGNALAGAEIVPMTRGRIKGSNAAGTCTLAFISGMAVFTTIDDCALHAALMLRRTFPDQPYLFSAKNVPNMPGGQFVIPAMRQYYALRALDEIYQTIWRTAVRNDKPVEAIIAVPMPEWLVALWRTVMPYFNLGVAYKVVDKKTVTEWRAFAAKEKAAQDQGTKDQAELDPNFERDAFLDGLRVICSPPGQEFSKTQIAMGFGYEGDNGWKDNKKRIMTLLGSFFEEGSTNRVLRRK